LPFHLLKALLSRPAEQLALNGGALHIQAAGRHEGLTAHRAIGEIEDRGLGHIGFGRHGAQMKLGGDAFADLFGIGVDQLGGQEGQHHPAA
jgi:hypothetical protein